MSNDIGDRYLNELISRSFFQDIDEALDSKLKSCKMHDLALSVGGLEWLIVDSNTNMITEIVRHLLFSRSGLTGQEFPTYLLKVNNVRSLNFLFDVGPLSKSFIKKLAMNLKCVRVLDLSWSEFEELPSSIGNLKYLRFLSLSDNQSIKAHPNSICKLLNLQFLGLADCGQLKELPKDTGNLINLRRLYLTSQQLCLPEKGLQGWTSLRFLRLYRCKNLASLSEGIQHLTALRELIIQECPMISSLPISMKYLTSLEKLDINDCQKLNLLNKDEECLNGLRHLRSLSINGLPKLAALPQGIQKLASTLQYLCIRNCSNLATLPEWLKDLTSLQVLYILDCPNVLSLPDGMDRLTTLQQLGIRGCPHLSKRCEPKTGEDWPKISHVPQIFH